MPARPHRPKAKLESATNGSLPAAVRATIVLTFILITKRAPERQKAKVRKAKERVKEEKQKVKEKAKRTLQKRMLLPSLPRKGGGSPRQNGWQRKPKKVKAKAKEKAKVRAKAKEKAKRANGRKVKAVKVAPRTAESRAARSGTRVSVLVETPAIITIQS